MTSAYRQRIINVIYMLQEHPDLFANLQAERQALSRSLPNDIIQAANVITRWCKTHASIYGQLLTMPNAETGQIRSISGNPPQYDPTSDLGLLNQLRVNLASQSPSSPLPSSPPPSDASTADESDSSVA